MKRKGFTLVEVLMAVLLVGIAIAALMGSNLSFTQTNAFGEELATAQFLIEQIRELTALLAFYDPQTGKATFGPEEANLADWDDLDDFAGAIFNPPINARKTAISELSSYTQIVNIKNVSANNFEQTVANHSSDFIRVTVTITVNSKTVSSASWVRARY